MTILITSDIHLNDNPRDSYRHRWVEKLPELAKRHNADTIFMLGDLTDEKDRHSAWLVNTIVKHFYKLSDACRVIILRGNHDYLSDSNNSFYRFLCAVNGITWINDPMEVRLDSGTFLFLPHTHDYKRDWKEFDFSKYKFSKYNYVFTHNTFNNADVGRTLRLIGIPTNVFPRDTKVISGDIHVPQTLDNNITYVGAPYTIDFGDSYDPRVLLLKDRKLISIPCEGPQKRLVECVAGKPLSDIPLLCKGDILKIRIQVTTKQMDKWQETKNELRAWGDKHGYTIDSIQPLLDKASVSLSKKPTTEKSKNDEETFLEYAKMQRVDERTVKTGLKLLQEG